jgi:hypothetical protein
MVQSLQSNGDTIPGSFLEQALEYVIFANRPTTRRHSDQALSSNISEFITDVVVVRMEMSN